MPEWLADTEWLNALSGTLLGRLEFLIPIAVVATLLQVVFPAIRRPVKIKSYEFWLDALYQFQPTLLGLTAFQVGVTASSIALRDLTPPLAPIYHLAPGWLRVLLAVWMFDFVVYWRHRLEHDVSFLWPIHAVHHTSRQLDWMTTLRLHPLEVFAGGVLTGWLFGRIGLDGAALGQGVGDLALGFTIYLHYNYFIHTNVRVRYPGFLKYVLVSPFMHRWHHATAHEAVGKNLGVVFAWNDWLFGSAYHPDHEPPEYGLRVPEGEEVREGYFAQVVYPFRVWARRVAAWAKRDGLAAASAPDAEE